MLAGTQPAGRTLEDCVGQSKKIRYTCVCTNDPWSKLSSELYTGFILETINWFPTESYKLIEICVVIKNRD